MIWLEADITNKRPEVVAEYYLSAVQMLKGLTFFWQIFYQSWHMLVCYVMFIVSNFSWVFFGCFPCPNKKKWKCILSLQCNTYNLLGCLGFIYDRLKLTNIVWLRIFYKFFLSCIRLSSENPCRSWNREWNHCHISFLFERKLQFGYFGNLHSKSGEHQ